LNPPSKNSTRTTTYADFETPLLPYFAEKVRSFCAIPVFMRDGSGGDSKSNSKK